MVHDLSDEKGQCTMYVCFPCWTHFPANEGKARTDFYALIQRSYCATRIEQDSEEASKEEIMDV